MLQSGKNRQCDKNLSRIPTSELQYDFKPCFEAVLFDLFDTLVLIDDYTTSFDKSLLMMHTYLSHNGLDCSFDDFKSAYLIVEKEISAETACTLEEPHFSVYVERVLASLGAKLKAQTHLATQAVDEFSKEFARHISLDPQALEVLRFLHQRCKTAVVSNLTFSEFAWELLERFELDKHLDLIVVSGDINLRKPHPQIFNRALQHLGVQPAKALFIGDTLETDIAGARNAGLTSVQIMRRRPINSIIKPHVRVTELNQLISIFDFPADLGSTTLGEVDLACQA
jgi:HAD superfamily hydrolase (TIGR01549 family)